MAIGRTIGVSAILSFGLGNSLTNMGRAKASFKDLHDAAKKAKQGLSDVWSGMQGMTRIGAVAALGMGWGIKTFAKFDEAAAALESRLDKGGLGIDVFKKKALALGKETKFTATEILAAMGTMKQFGLEDKDVLGQIFSVAKLATSENMSLAKSSLAVFRTTGALGWPVKKATDALDLLAFTSNKTASTIPELVEGLKLAGTSAQLLNIEGSAAVKVLGLFSKASLYGSRGGTVFASVLAKIAAAQEDGVVALEGGASFGIERSLNKFNKKMGVNLIQTLLNAAVALNTIGNESDRLAAGKSLFGTRGVRFFAAVGKYATSKKKEDQAELLKLFGPDVQKDIKGFMDKMFQIRQKNLWTDWVKLTSAINTFGISMSRNFGGRLRGTVQKATSYISDAATAVDHYTKNWSKLGKAGLSEELFKKFPMMNRDVATFVQSFLVGLDSVGKKALWVAKSIYNIAWFFGWTDSKFTGSLAGKMTGVAVAVGGITAALFLAKLAFGPFLRMGLGAARLLIAAYGGVAAKIGAAKAASIGAAGASKIGNAAGKLNKLLAQPVLVTNWPPGLMVPGAGGPVPVPLGAGGAAGGAKKLGMWTRFWNGVNMAALSVPIFGTALTTSISKLGLFSGSILGVIGKLGLVAGGIAAMTYGLYKLAELAGVVSAADKIATWAANKDMDVKGQAAEIAARGRKERAEAAASDFASGMINRLASGRATADVNGSTMALSRENVVAEIKKRLSKRGVTSDDAQQRILEKLGPLLEKFNLTSEGGLQNKLMTDIYSNRPINLYIDGTQVATAVDKHKLGLKERDLSTKAVKPKRAATLGALGMKGAGFFPGR